MKTVPTLFLNKLMPFVNGTAIRIPHVHDLHIEIRIIALVLFVKFFQFSIDQLYSRVFIRRPEILFSIPDCVEIAATHHKIRAWTIYKFGVDFENPLFGLSRGNPQKVQHRLLFLLSVYTLHVHRLVHLIQKPIHLVPNFGFSHINVTISNGK